MLPASSHDVLTNDWNLFCAAVASCSSKTPAMSWELWSEAHFVTRVWRCIAEERRAALSNLLDLCVRKSRMASWQSWMHLSAITLTMPWLPVERIQYFCKYLSLYKAPRLACSDYAHTMLQLWSGMIHCVDTLGFLSTWDAVNGLYLETVDFLAWNLKLAWALQQVAWATFLLAGSFSRHVPAVSFLLQIRTQNWSLPLHIVLVQFWDSTLILRPLTIKETCIEILKYQRIYKSLQVIDIHWQGRVILKVIWAPKDLPGIPA